MNKRALPMKVAGAAMAALLAVSMPCTAGGISAASARGYVQPSLAYAADGAASQQVTESLRGVDAAALGDLAVEDAYTLPVRMLKRAADEASMASPLLHPTAYAVKDQDVYRVTVYFVNAAIMGSTIYAGALGEATYDKGGDGLMVAADSDVYDVKTQVKAVTLTVKSLDAPVQFHLDMFMDNVRLSFDTSQMARADGEPAFPEVESSAVKYPADSIAVIGGSGSDEANALARCANGSIVVAGSTSSLDGSFSGRSSSDERPYVCICSSDGEVLGASYLDGADKMSIFDLSAADDSSFYACGYFQMREGAAAGDFADLTKEGCEGSRNGFVARYSANGRLQWVRSLCSPQACQFAGVTATPDGGCVAVAECLKGAAAAGDYADEMKGIVNTIVVKYDADGNEAWHTVLTGASIISSDGAIAVTGKGTCLLAGQFAGSSSEGALSSLDRFGGTFDLYVLELGDGGAVVSARSFGGSGTNESVSSILPASDGGFVMTGNTESTDGTFAPAPAYAGASNGFTMKCGSDGSVAWVDTYKSSQGNEALKAAATTEGYAVIGYGEGKDGAFTQLAKGQRDVFVALYDEQGRRSGLQTFGGAKNEYAAGIVDAGDGRYLFLVESESSDVDMDGVSRGGSDAVLVWASQGLSADVRDAMERESAEAAGNLLGKLPDAWNVTEADAGAIAAARDAFDALSADATALVPASSVARLQAAESAIALTQNDRSAAKRFADALASLPSSPGTADAAAVSQARAAYDVLTVAQRQIVPAGSLSTLEAAEKAVAAAQEEAAQAAKAAAEEAARKAADQVAADKVVALVKALPSTATVKHASAVAKARSAYNGLTAAQKKLVPSASLKKLVKAETQVKAAKAAAAAEAKAKKVKTVTVNVGTVSAKAVKAAVAAKGGKPAYVTKVVLGAKAKTVSASAFKGMSSLAALTLGKNVKTLKPGAFKGAKSLKTVTVNSAKLTKKSVKGCLKGSSVLTVKVPKSKKAAYRAAFAKSNSGKAVTVK